MTIAHNHVHLLINGIPDPTPAKTSSRPLSVFSRKHTATAARPVQVSSGSCLQLVFIPSIRWSVGRNMNDNDDRLACSHLDEP